jgi:DNA-binding transcriptional LysR family regulator
MQRLTFDLDVLRTFVVGIDLESFAKAADRLGRSTSAVSAQLKKLEDQVGVPVLRKSGRGLVLTPTGEVLFAYARRLLELNDEAATAVRGVDLEGWVRIGLQEDFAESLLTKILGDFARAHPRVRVEARVSRNAELLELVSVGRLDLALAWDSGFSTPHSKMLGNLPMTWICPSIDKMPCLTAGEAVPLVVFDAPCIMRSAATTALDKSGIPWRIAFTSPSLSGIWAAVEAGLGVTVRTHAGLPTNLFELSGMPELPKIGLTLHSAEADPTDVIQRLSEIVKVYLDEVMPLPNEELALIA